MEARESGQARFVFPALEPTPEHTPATLTPCSSHMNLSDLNAIINDSDHHLAELLDERFKLKGGLSAIPHFRRTMGEAQDLLRLHGPYTTYAGTSVFSRAPIARDSTEELSVEDLADSFAAAQDCIGCAQLQGPARDDLAIFERLWHITVSILEAISRAGDLDHETLGWGIFGMCAGYVGHNSRREEEAFLSLKKRLHVALRAMPSMEAPIRKKEGDLAKLSGGPVASLTKANREIHICASLLLQQFRREEFKRIHWYHGIAIASRWIQHLGLEEED